MGMPSRSEDLFHDVPAQDPAIRIALDEVRISGQQIPVLAQDPLFGGRKEVLCHVEAAVSLRGDQRGVHMSRIEQSFLTEVPNQTLPGAALEIARTMRGLQQQETARVTLSAVVPLRTTTRVTGLVSPDTVQVTASAKVGKNAHVSASLLANNIVACPCMQTYALTDLASALEMELDSVLDLLTRVPIATHSQKGYVRLEVQAPQLDQLPDFATLYRVVDQSTTLTQELLKRPDEYELIRRAHLDAQFVEDVTRAATINLLKEFGEHVEDLPSGICLDVQAKSYESIHGHDISAHVRTVSATTNSQSTNNEPFSSCHGCVVRATKDSFGTGPLP
jgi:GTP cyclohydrolase-4